MRNNKIAALLTACAIAMSSGVQVTATEICPEESINSVASETAQHIVSEPEPVTEKAEEHLTENENPTVIEESAPNEISEQVLEEKTAESEADKEPELLLGNGGVSDGKGIDADRKFMLFEIPMLKVEPKGYDAEYQDAIYLREDFEEGVLPASTGSGTAELYPDSGEYGKTLKLSGEVSVSYTLPGNTVKWDGKACSTAFEGDGTEKNPYLIKSGADLKFLQKKVNGGTTYEGKYFKLVNNIDLQNKEWEPIGNSSKRFKGNFDGNFNKVINIKRTVLGTSKCMGFFGYLQGTVSNFGVENVDYKLENKSSNKISTAGGMVGTLLGTMDNCFARNVRIENTSATQSIEAVGGVVGTVQTSSTEQSFVQSTYAVDVTYISKDSSTSAKIGQLIGYSKSSSNKINVYYCYVAGKFEPSSNNANYYTFGAVEKVANIKSGNNVVANEVTTYKTNLTQVEPEYEVLTPTKMKGYASNLGEIFANDVTGMINKGFPYHKKCMEVPNEAVVSFDVEIDSSGLDFAILNSDGTECAKGTVEKSCGKGWHTVSVDMKETGYTVTVDGKNPKTENYNADMGHGTIIFSQKNGGACRVDNIIISEDCSEELSKVADVLFETIGGKETLSAVTKNVDLCEIVNNHAVAWESSVSNIIKKSGEVTRHAVDLPVTLTATYDGNSPAGVQKAFATVKFDAVVKAREGVTDVEKVNDILNFYLNDSLLTDDSLDNITKDLNKLPTEFEGAEIIWESDSPEYIATDGAVTLPEIDSGDAEVTLKVTVKLGSVIKQTEFVLTVKAPLSDSAKLKLAADAIKPTNLTVENIDEITKDLVLPESGKFNSMITWSTDNSAVISKNGVVVRQNEDVFVSLTAHFTLNGVKLDKVYHFIVLMSEKTRAQKDADALTDLGGVIEDDFGIETVGSLYSSEITWTSNNEAITLTDGYATVTRPKNGKGDASVTLTATVTYGAESVTRKFNITVPQEPDIQQVINEAYDSITWETISTEAKESITYNLSLPTDFGYGVTAKLISNPEGYVDGTGIVTRPDVGEPDRQVNLKLVIGDGITERTKEFDVTVKAFENDAAVLEKAVNELTFSQLSGEEMDMVTQNLKLPASWRYNTTVTWETSDASCVKVEGEEGKVIRPEFGKDNKEVMLTANVSYNGQSKIKKFYFTVAEVNGTKTSFLIDVEKYDFGEMKSKDNIVVNKSYLAAEVVEDPENPQNKVFKLSKDSSFSASAQKGFQIKATDEKKGRFEFTAKMRFESVPDRNFYICGVCGTGEEIGITGSRSSSGVTIAGKLIPYNVWTEVKVEIDTFDKSYSVYVGGVFGKKYDFKYKATKPSEIGLVRFYYDFIYNSASGEHVVYVDDITLTKKIDYASSLATAASEFETVFLTGQDISNITEDLIIPEISIFETTVETKSSDPKVVSDSGEVTRPQTSDAKLTFTVTYKNNYGGTRQKEYELTVKAENSEDLPELNQDELDALHAKEDLEEAVAYIYDNCNVNAIVDNLSLQTVGVHGAEITYESSDGTVLSQNGTVNRNDSGDTEVTLKVTAKVNEQKESKEIKLTVKKAIVDPDFPKSISSSSGVSGVPLGGNSITSVKPTGKNSAFWDILDHWAKDYIEQANKDGIVSGKGDGEFDPNGNVTREEFVTMLINVLGLETEEPEQIFDDVKSDAWYEKYINTAYKNGIVNGISENVFGISQNISRQDMCVMAFNAFAEYLSGDFADDRFSDDADLAEYARQAVYTLKNAGIVNGRGNNEFQAHGTATRAEATVIICLLRNVIKK